MIANARQRSNWGEDIFSLSLQEILGAEAFKKLLQRCDEKNPAAEPVAETMQEMYGPTGARGLLVCSGRTAFKYLLNREGAALGFDNPQFRLLPTRSKLKRGLHQIAAWMQHSTGDKIEIKNEETHWVFEVSDQESGQPQRKIVENCDFTVGLLQEFLAWAGGGKFYRVKESTCRTAGASCCSFIVDKYPLE